MTTPDKQTAGPERIWAWTEINSNKLFSYWTTKQEEIDYAYSGPVKYLRADLAASLVAENKRLLRACSKQNSEICDVLGRVLGYPWFKDDQKNFPGATEKDGVCVGDHVAESLADEAATKIARLSARVAELERLKTVPTVEELEQMFANTEYMVPVVKAWAIEHAIGICKAIMTFQFERAALSQSAHPRSHGESG